MPQNQQDSANYSPDTTRYFLKFQNRILTFDDSGSFLASSGFPILPYSNLVFDPPDSLFLNPATPFPQNNFFALNPIFNFNGQRPVTIIQTEVNSFKEQLFSIAHKRDFAKSSGLWFKLFSCRTPGVFNNLLGNSFAVDWGAYFNLKKSKIRLDFYHRKEFFQLNGGVVGDDDDQPFSILGNQRKLLPVRWTNLSVRKIESAANLEAVFPLKNSELPKDSSENGLIGNISAGRFGSYPTALVFNSRYSLDYFFVNQFYLPEDSFFVNKPSLYDSLNSSDRLRNANFSNVFGFLNQSFVHQYNFFAYLSFQYNERNQNFFKSQHQSLFSGFDFEKKFDSQKLILKANYGITGYNRGNFLFLTTYKKRVYSIDDAFVSFTLNSSRNSASLTEQNFFANRFFWTNTLESTFQHSLSAQIKFSKMSMELTGSRLKNYIYYNTDFIPTQHRPSINYFKAVWAAKLETKRVFFVPEVVYQNDFSDEKVLRIPSFISKSIIGFNAKLFGKALILSPGLDLLFVNNNFGKYFLPHTGQFINQDTVSSVICFRANLFVNFALKELKGYLRMDNITDGIWPANTSSLLVGNPFPGRVIRIGFIWNLIN